MNKPLSELKERMLSLFKKDKETKKEIIPQQKDRIP
jgi:hypothetical protein